MHRARHVLLAQRSLFIRARNDRSMRDRHLWTIFVARFQQTFSPNNAVILLMVLHSLSANYAIFYEKKNEQLSAMHNQ